MTTSLIFYVNGKRIEESTLSVDQTLAHYLRDRLRLVGCKIGCGQGVCGSCTVLLSYCLRDSIRHEAVNACLLPLLACHMTAITTVEGLGSIRTRLHPIQEALAKGHAIQCGFCTPGFVMSAYALLRNRNGSATPEELDRALRGNLCRCTGYRPILQAVKGVCCEGGCCQSKNNGIKDPENNENSPIDVTQELIFPPELLTTNSNKAITLVGQTWSWVVPPNWTAVEEELQKNPRSLIVGGNTMQPLADSANEMQNVINLRNINEFTCDGTNVIIGAGMKLGDLEHHMRDSSFSDSVKDFSEAVLQILDSHTSSQIKSVATVGGTIASSIRYPFLSVLLMSLDSKLYIFDRRSSHSSIISISQLRENIMPHIVISRVQVSLASVSKIRFFQPCDKPLRWTMSMVMRQTGESSLSYTVSGDKEGEYKICIAHGTIPSLLQHLEKSEVNEDAQKLYRAWMDKFIRCDDQEPDNIGLREAIQTFPAQLTSDTVLGTPAVTTKAIEATTGEATYLDDISLAKDELQLGLVQSAYSHAKILSIDPSEALTMPGVVSFISASDSPCNLFSVLLPPSDEEVFAEKEVTYLGQPVGAIAAETREIALKAVKLVRVECEPLPAVTTIKEAESKNQFHRSAFCSSHENSIQGGDTTGAGRAVVHGEIDIDGQEHFYMEPQSALVLPTLEDTFLVYLSSHGPNNDQKVIAEVLKLPSHNIEVRTMRVGGSFGGKEVRAVISALPAAVAAHKLRRPVRCVFTRDLDIRISGERHPLHAKYDISLENGRIDGMWYDATVDGGATLDVSTIVRDNLITKCQSGYRVPNFRYCSKACKTNNASNTAFRGFGGPQGMMILEMAIEHAAQTLGLCPDEIREKSIVRQGDKDSRGNSITDDNLQLCFTKCKAKSEYDRRRAEISQFNNKHEDRKRGIALIPTRFGIGYESSFLNQGSAIINVYASDGSIILHHAGVEIGQGIDIKMKQVASHVLGLPLSLFRVYPFSTNILPNTSPTAASSTTDLVGPAVIDACKTIANRLNWTPMPGESEGDRVKRWRGVVFNAYMAKVDLSARGFFAHSAQNGNFLYFTCGVACSEVELNCLTGEYKLLRADIVMDVGKSLNPAVDVGQIEGGFMQGYGLFCKERLKFAPNEGLPEHVVYDYTIPTVSDVPQHFNVHLLTDTGNQAEHAVYSSKGIGEPPFFLGSSVYFAMRRALHAIHEDSGKFVKVDCPATSDRVRKAIEEMRTWKK